MHATPAPLPRFTRHGTNMPETVTFKGVEFIEGPNDVWSHHAPFRRVRIAIKRGRANAWPWEVYYSDGLGEDLEGFDVAGSLDDAIRAAVSAWHRADWFDPKTAPHLQAPPPSIKDRGMPSEPTDIARTLGQQLRTAREAAGLTQSDAAALAGVTPGRWSQMESGSTSNLNKLHAACVAIGAVLDISVRTPRDSDI